MLRMLSKTIQSPDPYQTLLWRAHRTMFDVLFYDVGYRREPLVTLLAKLTIPHLLWQQIAVDRAASQLTAELSSAGRRERCDKLDRIRPAVW
jgi:hypothetical protein